MTTNILEQYDIDYISLSSLLTYQLEISTNELVFLIVCLDYLVIVM